MFHNYFKLAYRNLLSNKLVSFINVFGLSIAIACCIAIFLFLQNNWTMDNFHVNGDRIYLAEYVIENPTGDQVWGNSPMPLGPALESDFPQVERSVRVLLRGGDVYLNDRAFEELVYFADPGYFDMFTFPLQSGNASILTEPDAIVVSHDLANKYFPEEEALGKTITISFSNQQKKAFTVKAVAEPFPENTGFKFDILAGMDVAAALNLTSLYRWDAASRGTFVQLKKGTDIAALATNMDKYIALQNAVDEDRPVQSFIFDNLKSPNPKAFEVIRRPAEVAHPSLTLIFAGLALLMMALSCFNYINISLGSSAKRLKEIAVRKAIGGKKRQLVWQFMSENMLLCLIALLLGLAFTQAFLVPLFNATMVTKITLSFSKSPVVLLFLLGLLVFTGVASGAYPAFYISAFKTVSIFRGKSLFTKKSKLTRAFLSIQFVLAFGTVIASVLLLSAEDYWKELSWGYQPDQTMVVRLDEQGKYDLLKNEALLNSHITQVGGSAHHVGESVWRHNIYIGDKEFETIRYDVGAGYFESLGLQLKRGRFFDPHLQLEDENSAIINEAFAFQNNWDEPIGQQFRSGGQAYTIVGIVEDFKIIGTGAAMPAVFQLTAEDRFNYLTLRYEPGAGEQVETFMSAAWKRHSPETPFSFFHQEMVFEDFYSSYKNATTSFSYIAMLAVLIACMGLFGLSVQNYASRIKEASIRKILGASTQQIILNANRSFLIMLSIAGVIATGVCFGGVQLIVASFEEYIGKMELGIWPYLGANLIVLMMAIVAIGGQAYKLANVAPSENLRSE